MSNGFFTYRTGDAWKCEWSILGGYEVRVAGYALRLPKEDKELGLILAAARDLYEAACLVRGAIEEGERPSLERCDDLMAALDKAEGK